MSKDKKDKTQKPLTKASARKNLPLKKEENTLPMLRAKSVPAVREQSRPLASRNSFDLYIQEINRVKLLTREEEFELAKQFQEGDKEAARSLVEANLRFVVKIAHSYKHFNVKLVDLVQEGNIGLMKAVQKFNPDKGYRLISYAVWWIKAYMQNYIIRSWSMVRVGTAQAQRQLFFRMQDDPETGEEAVRESLAVDDLTSRGGSGGIMLVPAASRRSRSKKELNLAARDFSLDAEVGDEGRGRFVDMLEAPELSQEEALVREDMLGKVSARLAEVVDSLSDKEQYILQVRLLSDEPKTLQVIGEHFGVSRERIRQIETQLKKRLAVMFSDIEGVSELW
jgi:RNA polymerase sigma-32 factor